MSCYSIPISSTVSSPLLFFITIRPFRIFMISSPIISMQFLSSSMRHVSAPVMNDICSLQLVSHNEWPSIMVHQFIRCDCK